MQLRINRWILCLSSQAKEASFSNTSFSVISRVLIGLFLWRCPTVEAGWLPA
jgi:hypothetical protein